MVHDSRGRLIPGSPRLRSEVAIVTGLGHALFGDDIGWRAMGDDYAVVRKHIEHVVPGFHAYEERAVQPGGFMLPRGRTTRAPSIRPPGRPASRSTRPRRSRLPEGHLLLETVRAHDQFNTTVYGLDDRYRCVKGWRRVVFVNAADLRACGLDDGELVDVVSVFADGERRARAFRTVRYPVPRGCAAAYYPATDVLVPLDSTAEVSNTPASKSIVVRLERAV